MKWCRLFVIKIFEWKINVIWNFLPLGLGQQILYRNQKSFSPTLKGVILDFRKYKRSLKGEMIKRWSIYFWWKYLGELSLMWSLLPLGSGQQILYRNQKSFSPTLKGVILDFGIQTFVKSEKIKYLFLVKILWLRKLSLIWICSL